MRIVWKGHAIERAIERFGADPSIRIPNRILVKDGLNREIGDNYEISYKGVTYCCRRGDTEIVIKTVYPTKG